MTKIRYKARKRPSGTRPVLGQQGTRLRDTAPKAEMPPSDAVAVNQHKQLAGIS